YMPERMTNDLDILIHKRDSDEIRRRLTQSGAMTQGELAIGGSSWALSDGFPLDIMEWDESWVDTAIVEAQANRDGQGLPVLPLPYLVLIKFRASRAQDVADVVRMLGQATEDQLGATRALFAEWLPRDIGDLESLIALGRLE